MIFTLSSLELFTYNSFKSSALIYGIIFYIFFLINYNFKKMSEKRALKILEEQVLNNMKLKLENKHLDSVINSQENVIKNYREQINDNKLDVDYYKGKFRNAKLGILHWKKKYNEKPIIITEYASSLIDKYVKLNGDCPICLDELKTKDVVITICGHILHKECFEDYKKTCLSDKKVIRCPVCRL